MPTVRHIRRSVPPQHTTVRCSIEPTRQDHNLIVVSDSDSDTDTEDTELSPPPLPFDTFAPDHVPVTPVTPVMPQRYPRPSPVRSPGVIPLGATQLLTALDLQLLHTPCDRSLPEGFPTPTGSETSVLPLNFDSDAEIISMGSDSDSSASTEVSVPRKKRKRWPIYQPPPYSNVVPDIARSQWHHDTATAIEHINTQRTTT